MSVTSSAMIQKLFDNFSALLNSSAPLFEFMLTATITIFAINIFWMLIRGIRNITR